MNLEGFHRYFRSSLRAVITDRIDAGESPFPSEELVFAEMVMNHAEEAGLCEAPIVCYWKGRVGNASLRIAGYAVGSDESSLDLFVTHYTGSDCLENLSNSVVTSAARECMRFLTNAARSNLEARIDPTHSVRDLVATIRSNWDALDRLRIFVLTDGRLRAKRFAPKEVNGTIVAIEVMDMERLYRHVEGKPRDELAISLVQAIGSPLPCVHVPDPDADYAYALTAIPGQVIKGLYERFGPRLLEANVRTFLGTTRKVNKGIVRTLREEPEHFLAYNNGLVIVCDEAAFERTDDGGIGISFLKGLQIVNGGQTTSALYFASRDNRTIDLSHVMVPAKVIILSESDNDQRERLITSVTCFANSQSTIRMSDLSANRPFHIQLEGLANEIWCSDGATRWFYERASGAYNVMMLRDGTTPARRRRLREEIPPKRKLTKNDVAKYHEAWRGRPWQVAMGGEKNFAAFMKALDNDSGIIPDPLDADWYRSMIAKVILFKSIERMIKNKEAKKIFRQGWGNIAAYVVAVVSNRLGDRLDLEMIWRLQNISPALAEHLWECAIVVNAEFGRIAPGQQISEVAKREITWTRIGSTAYPEPKDSIPELAPANANRIAEDGTESMEWCLRRAKLGNAEAQYRVGRLFADGNGVTQDDVAAAEWYRQAAEQGHVKAQINLGLMYGEGLGVPKDEAEAVRLYRLAAEQNHATAQYNLGVMYAEGIGVPQDETEAVKWYRLAAEQGHSDAQFNLGVMYESGQGVPQDNVEAVGWYRLASKQGDADAQYNLGVMYADGLGVAEDRQEASRLYRLAADQGHAEAKRELDG